MTRFVRALTPAAVCGLMVVTGQTPAPIGSYTAVQAVDGRAAYQANCASCHLPDLAGRNEATQLAGAHFVGAWGARPISELLTYIQSTMPPGNTGSLSPETYADLVAFLLEANGATAGSQPLTSKTVSLIRSAATGRMPAALRQALRQAS